MDFPSARDKYAQLKQLYDEGRINAEDFARQAGELTVTTAEGQQWRIDAGTGRWNMFNGQQWVEAVPPLPKMPTPVMPAAPGQPAARSTNWPCIIGAVAGVVVLGCLVAAGAGFFMFRNNIFQQTGSSNATPIVHLPIEATQSSGAPATSEAFGGAFTDDFSDPSSGWDRNSDTDGVTDYSNGKYQILVKGTSLRLWATPGQNYTGDVNIDVDATKAGGPDDNILGVICRYQDTDNFYRFFISSDGYAAIGKRLAGESTLISSDKMQPASAIHTGAATNHIRASCIGSVLTLSVNGQEVARVTDSSLDHGDVGLIAGTYDTGGVNILFDNFVASEH